ncbi:MAG: MFS transporter [Lentisphaerae bacterium]|nr:MFS transporter [Lentisphaerota bacterium]
MRLNKAQWCWLLYDPGNAAFALLVRAVFAPLFFMLCVRGIWNEGEAAGKWGLLCSGAGVAAGFFSLYCGALADAAVRRKLALAISTLLGIFSTVALAMVNDYRWVMIWYFLALAAFMLSNSFYDSLLISVAEPEKFSYLSTLAYGFGYLGGLLPFLAMLGLGGLLKDSALTSRIAFVTAAVWWGIFMLPLLLVVKEQGVPQKNVRFYAGFAQLVHTLKDILHHRNVLIFLIAYFLYIDGVSTILMMAAPISIDIGMSEYALMGTILGLQIIGFPATVAAGKLAQRFGARRIVYVELALYVITAALIGVLSLAESASAKLALFLTAALLIALAQGGIQSLSRSLFGLLIPAEKAAEFFGVYNIFGKFTTVLGPILVYAASQWWQRSEYGIVMLIVPFLLGGFMLGKVKFPAGK